MVPIFCPEGRRSRCPPWSTSVRHRSQHRSDRLLLVSSPRAQPSLFPPLCGTDEGCHGLPSRFQPEGDTKKGTLERKHCLCVAFTKTALGCRSWKLTAPRAPPPRRRERRLRQFLRRERPTVAVALAEKLHRTSRGQMITRATEEENETNIAMADDSSSQSCSRRVLPIDVWCGGGWRPCSRGAAVTSRRGAAAGAV